MQLETARRPAAFWPVLLIVLAVAAIGGWVRWLIASGEILWIDELHTSWCVAGDFGDVYQRALSGNQTPLYFWTSWLFVEVFGKTEFSIRLVSLISGVGTIVAAAWLVWRWTASAIATVATSILIALDFQFIYYATEARPYALIQFLGMIQVALFWRFITADDSTEQSESLEHTTQRRFRWLGLSMLSVVTALLLYTHLTSAWLLIAEVLFVAVLLVVQPSFRRQHLSRILKVTGFTALISIPAMLSLWQLVGRRSNWSSISSIPRLLEQQTMPLGCWILLPAIAMLVAILFRAIGFKSASQGHAYQWKRLGFVLLWALLPTLGVIALDRFELAPMALVRYTWIGAVAMPVFAGLVIGFVGVSKIRLVLAIALIAASLVWSPITSGKFVSSGFDARQLPGLRLEDWRSPISAINTNQAKQNHPLFLASNLIEDVDAFENSEVQFQEYLRFPLNGFYQIENENSAREIIPIPTLLRERTRDSDIEKIKNSGGAWLIVRGPRDLAFEIEDEIVSKIAIQFPDAGEPTTVHFGDPHGLVYLVSFDW